MIVDGKTLVIVLVLQVLEKYTDEDHYLTLNQIKEKLEQDYFVTAEKKTISRYVNLLMDAGYGIDRDPRRGVSLTTRKFDDTEIMYLVDAIFSSKSCPGNVAKDISTKLSEMLSSHQYKFFKHIYKTGEINRTNNKQVFYNIDIIHEAIEKGYNIKFKYLTYDENGNQTTSFNGYEYQVSPYNLINNFGHYYLLGYRRRHGNKEDIYRVDNMVDIEIDTTRKIYPIENIDKFKNGFNISKYINEHIYLFGGDVITAKLKLKKSSVITYIKDWFGEKAIIEKIGDDIIATVRCNGNAFFYWCLQYYQHIEVISPKTMREKLYNAGQALIDTYKPEE